MAHSRCLSCRARVWREGSSPADLCPGCGGPLQQVSDLSELVGFRCLRARPRSERQSSPEQFARISEQIREQIARNDTERQRRIERSVLENGA
jgi:hypothetical protein